MISRNMFQSVNKVGPLLFCGNALFFLIDGYNVSNIVNVQVPIYNAFGKTQMLSWVNLAYALTSVAFVPVVRKLFGVCAPNTLGIVGSISSMLGSLFAGFARNIETVILGRFIMAIGSVILNQIDLFYSIEKVPRSDFTKTQALTGIFFPLGSFVGPLISGAFAHATQVTWRWAYFIVIPVLMVAAVLLFVGYESLSLQLDEAVAEKQQREINHGPIIIQSNRGTAFKSSEWIGIFSWVTFFILFGLGCTFSGSVWAWKSAPTVVVWVLLDLVAGVLTAHTLLQQTRMRRGEQQDTAIPVMIARQSGVFFPELCVFLASIGYGTTLYYMPIYFVIVHRDNTFDAAKHLLPFIGVVILAVLTTGYLGRARSLQLLLMVAGAALLTVGAGLQQKITVDASINSVMGYEAIVGAGVGLMWQTTLAMSSEVLGSADGEIPRDKRMDINALHHMAHMGGVAVGIGIAGAIYQNVGIKLLESVAFAEDTSVHDLRELLAGANSAIFLQHPDVYAGVLEAIAETIRRCLYVNIAVGVLCLASSVFMSLRRASGHSLVGRGPVGVGKGGCD